MKRQPEISYIVSLYNRPEYLAVCLWALKMQTHQDSEIIVTDNSTDVTIVKQHQLFIKNLNDPRFSYVNTASKTAVSDCYWSSEYGMSLARGKWLCFPCEDCYYPPEWTQRMLLAAMANNWDLVLCENNITGPEPCGADRYMLLKLGTKSFPGYKPSFIVKASKFSGWLNKPLIGACSGVDRTTLQALTRNPQIQWGAVRDLFYVHN
jgi:glycosyltransferase involved in cell wall biosynthesis